jgi:hypothetical protein
MQRAIIIMGAVLLATAVTSVPARSQVFGTDNHTVTVQVAQITVIDLTVGAVGLTMANGTIIAGQDMMTVQNQTSQLRWGTNSSGRKITVRTSLAVPLFQLNLQAVNPTRGTAAPEITLSTVSQDLLLNVGRSMGSCYLRYTGIALASKGIGTDNHVITFTVQAQ